MSNCLLCNLIALRLLSLKTAKRRSKILREAIKEILNEKGRKYEIIYEYSNFIETFSHLYTYVFKC